LLKQDLDFQILFEVVFDLLLDRIYLIVAAELNDLMFQKKEYLVIVQELVVMN